MRWTFVVRLLPLLLVGVGASSLSDTNEDNSLLIEALRRNVTVTSGQRAVLTCTFAASEQDLSLSSSHQLIWIRQNYASNSADSLLAHNQDLLIADHRMSIQRTDADYTLTITDVHADDEGTYTCEVNTQPPQKASVHLYVQEISMIIDNATSSPIVVNEHDNVTMKCQARGRPTPFIAWFRRGTTDGRPPSNHSRPENQILANNTDGLYHLINVTRQQSGHYECRASNGVNDHVVSKDIELRVLFLPSIRAQSAVIHSNVGKSTHLRCSATAPSDTSLYWRRIDDHGIVSQSTRFRQQQHIHGDLSHTTLYIKDLEQADFGLYACYAESRAGRSKAVIELKEHQPSTTTTTTAPTIRSSVALQEQGYNETVTTTSRTQLLKRNKSTVSEHTTSVIGTSAAFFSSSSSFTLWFSLIAIAFLLRL